jgi:hypothetical protein
MTAERAVRLIAGMFILVSLVPRELLKPILVPIHRLCRLELVSVCIHQLVPDDDVPR